MEKPSSSQCRYSYCLEKYAGYLQHPFLLLFRLYWGYQFFMAGLGKFGNLEKVTGFFMSLNIPLPAASAYVVASVEMVGGALLILGLLSRLAAIPLSINMIVALMTAHADAVATIFSDADNFLAQKPIFFLTTTLLVLIFGPGLFSIDAILKKKWCRSADASSSCCSH